MTIYYPKKQLMKSTWNTLLVLANDWAWFQKVSSQVHFIFLVVAKKICWLGSGSLQPSVHRPLETARRKNYAFPCPCQWSTKIETELFSDVKLPLSRGLLLSKISFHFLLLWLWLITVGFFFFLHHRPNSISIAAAFFPITFISYIPTPKFG